MRRQPGLITLIVVALACAAWTTAFAQTPAAQAADDQRVATLIEEAWNAAVKTIAAKQGLRADGPLVSGTPEQRKAAYSEILDEVERQLDSQFSLLLQNDPGYAKRLIDGRADPVVRAAVGGKLESRNPVSANATSTNPLAAGLAERSGATTLASLASDLTGGLISADSSAVSLNLSALALVSLRDSDVYSSIADYQRHSIARRISGTVVFGAKIPEKDITGLSNLPEFDKLLDVFVWDVKVRVLGDKDPRSLRWFRQVMFLTDIPGHVPSLLGKSANTAQAIEDATMVVELLTARLGVHLAEIKAQMARSAQLSMKVSGTHLTKEVGKNKYSWTLLYDQGVGPTDLTANVQYAVTDDVRFGADQLFQTKIWTITAAATSHFAQDAIVEGRTVDLAVGLSAAVFADVASMPVPASNMWKLTGSVEFPVKGGGKIPVSVIYTNDPNSLTKQKYVSGLVGLSYDFSALKQLFMK